jgi:hypothetical protein
MSVLAVCAAVDCADYVHGMRLTSLTYAILIRALNNVCTVRLQEDSTDIVS